MTEMKVRDYSAIPTEKVNFGTLHIDTMSSLEIAEAMSREDQIAVDAVKTCHPEISRAMEIVAASLKSGGRLFYVGAGTSGRLGVLDASECPPTFSTSPEMVQAIIAGGRNAVWKAREGAEDSAASGKIAISRSKIGVTDAVCGIAASGVTPYVIGALEKASELGAKTIFVTCNPSVEADWVDVVIKADTGPETIQGSTRLKAGTATKLILNMLTTGAMILNGKVFGNRMVDLTPSCLKLRERATRIITEESGLSREEAMELLENSDWSVKISLLAALNRKKTQSSGKSRNYNIDKELNEARKALERSGGLITKALEEK